MQPIQQQGRRIPSLSSGHTRATCSRRVSGFLTEMTQQIHSLRASGVRSFHTVRAIGSDVRAFRKSAGSSCATPPEILLVIRIVYSVSSTPTPRMYSKSTSQGRLSTTVDYFDVRGCGSNARLHNRASPGATGIGSRPGVAQPPKKCQATVRNKIDRIQRRVGGSSAV